MYVDCDCLFAVRASLSSGLARRVPKTIRAFSSAVAAGGVGTGGDVLVEGAGELTAAAAVFRGLPGFFFAGRESGVGCSTGFLSSGSTSGSAELGGSSGFCSKGSGDGLLRILS